eukprot:2924591-Pleurochrysis_carterae.AAC.2
MPACSRLCIHAEASIGDITLTWRWVRKVCMARQRLRVEEESDARRAQRSSAYAPFIQPPGASKGKNQAPFFDV